MSETDCVTVTTVVAVDPATAFSIFTNEIHLWWKPKVRHLLRKDREGVLRFEPGPKGRLLEVYDSPPDEPLEIGRVLAWEPSERLSFEWRQNGFAPYEVTTVEIRFEPLPNGTRITLRHRGWDTLPAEHAARQGASGRAFTSMIGLRWGDLLTALRALAASRAGR